MRERESGWSATLSDTYDRGQGMRGGGTAGHGCMEQWWVAFRPTARCTGLAIRTGSTRLQRSSAFFHPFRRLVVCSLLFLLFRTLVSALRLSTPAQPASNPSNPQPSVEYGSLSSSHNACNVSIYFTVIANAATFVASTFFHLS